MALAHRKCAQMMTDISPWQCFRAWHPVTQRSAKRRNGMASYSVNFAATMRHWICRFSRPFERLILHVLDVPVSVLTIDTFYRR